MTDCKYAILDTRGILTVGGADRRAFLQGLVSNDVERIAADRAIWAAFLTPQGKYLHDFFMMEIGETLYLDCEGGERLMDFGRRLNRYKLRAEIEFGIADDYAVAVLFGDGAPEALGQPDEPGAARILDGGGALYMDPRLAAIGARAILPAGDAATVLEGLGFAAATAEDYDNARLALGLPDGSRDMVVEKSILLEANFEELNGVDWDKGCYMGQELTARTRYRGLVRKRLMPVAIEGDAPPPGTPLMLGDKEAGEMRSSRGRLGIALIRLERIEEAGEAPSLTAGDTRVTLRELSWEPAAAIG